MLEKLRLDFWNIYIDEIISDFKFQVSSFSIEKFSDRALNSLTKYCSFLGLFMGYSSVDLGKSPIDLERVASI